MLKSKQFLTKQLQNNHEYVLKQFQKVTTRLASIHLLNLPREVPNDLDEFYADFEPWVHDETGKLIERLAAYQYESWTDRWTYLYRLYIKSQKIGLSMLFLLEDIHHALTDCMGKQILLVAQSVVHAKGHLSDLISMIKRSKYRDYLIEKPVPWLKKWQVTKATIVYMHNPNNPYRPTEIYALGPIAHSLVSFKRVGHVHSSDITMAEYTAERLSKSIGAITSRVANTHGSVVFENPPSGFEGIIYDLAERDKYNKEHGYLDVKKKKHKQLSDIARKKQTDYLVRYYPYQLGLKAGVFGEAFIETKRKELGPLFDFYFGANFFSSDKTWYREEFFNDSDEATAAMMLHADSDDDYSVVEE